MAEKRVSIIIPMRNEERFVGPCLDSVLGQLGSAQYEVLCVDGASSDRTREIVLEYAGRDPRVRLVDNPQKIVPIAMNLGIRESSGEVIIRLDCHCEYALDYIRNCLEVLDRTGADNVGGYITTIPADDTAVGRAIAAATSSRFGVGGSAFRTGGEEKEADTVPFGCFRRDVFDRFGCYDERLARNQDIELNSRIRKGGGKIIISPAISLKYYTRSTFAGLRQQAFGNGLWNPYTLYLVGGGLRPRHLMPMLMVMAIAALGIGGIFYHPLWYALAACALVYGIAALSLGLPLARKARTSMWLVGPAFLQLHIWYGLGSLWGVLTAPLRFGIGHRRTRGVGKRESASGG